ncbi:epsin-2 isoform X4 [Sigmodon hispidus]
MKNIVNNYSEAEIKVREATSNDLWGSSSSLMTEVTNLSYNIVAFSEIMSMVWKWLNDHGKNWRHVYKALTLLDYLIKRGSELVAQKCRENIFVIQTLKGFQYIDHDGKHQGINDEERLKAERIQALQTKERMPQVATGVGRNHITSSRGSSQPNLSTSYTEQEYGKAGNSLASYYGSTSPRVSSELEQAWPQMREEELQLQLALAVSREVAEQKERLRRGDDLRSQQALEESRRDTVKVPKKKEVKACCKPGSHSQHTTLLDLMDALPSLCPLTQKTEPWGPGTSANQTNPWGGTAAPVNISDLWPSFGTKPAASVDPWEPASNAGKTADAWGAAKPSSASGSFELFINFNGTANDDFSEFHNLQTSPKTQKTPPKKQRQRPQDSRTLSADLFASHPLSSPGELGFTGNQACSTNPVPQSLSGARCCRSSPSHSLPDQPAPAANTEPALGEPCPWEQCILWVWSRGGACGLHSLSSPTLSIGGQWLFIDTTRPYSNEHGRQCGHYPVSSGNGHNQPFPSVVPSLRLA